MKTCRHLAAFRIDTTVVDPGHSGLPPWMSLCENCSADIVDALRATIAALEKQHPSGKSSNATRRAHLKRILDDVLGWQMQWQPDDSTVVEQFKARLGADYFNHGGLLRVTVKGSTVGAQFIEGLHELHAGDWLIIDADGKRRVQLAAVSE